MSEIAAISSWLPFWDVVAAITALCALIGAIGTYAIEFFSGKWVEWKTLVKNMCAVLVIAGAGGQIIAQLNISAINSQIVAFLNDQTARANERAGAANERAGVANERAGAADRLAGEAHERAANLELAVERLKKDNLILEAKNLELEKNVRGRQIADDQRNFILANFRRARREIIIVRTDTAEARLYADRLAEILKQARLVVELEDFNGTSPHTGVIVCEKAVGDNKIFDVLKRAQIATQFIKLRDQRPDFCDAAGVERPIETAIETITFGIVRPGVSSPRLAKRGSANFEGSLRIFVGQRPAIR